MWHTVNGKILFGHDNIAVKKTSILNDTEWSNYFNQARIKFTSYMFGFSMRTKIIHGQHMVFRVHIEKEMEWNEIEGKIPKQKYTEMKVGTLKSGNEYIRIERI